MPGIGAEPFEAPDAPRSMMDRTAFVGPLQRLLTDSAHGAWFLAVCGALAFVGSLGAAYPVTVIVVPAVLLMPGNWARITVATGLGSALGACVLMFLIHHIGWGQLHAHFPELAQHAKWTPMVQWVQDFGTLALFLVAASPLPQTPVLIFLGIGDHDYLSAFLAVLCGKSLKYGALAWLVSRFPQRFDSGLTGLFQRRQPRTDGPK